MSSADMTGRAAEFRSAPAGGSLARRSAQSGHKIRGILLVLCITCTSVSAFPRRSPKPETVWGRVVAYSSIPACLNGNGYWSVLIRVEKPKNLKSRLIRVDFSLPCSKSPEWISKNPLAMRFRLVRDKEADAVLSGCLEGECKENLSLPIWGRPPGGDYESLPFGQMLPSYRSIDLPLAPVV